MKTIRDHIKELEALTEEQKDRELMIYMFPPGFTTLSEPQLKSIYAGRKSPNHSIEEVQEHIVFSMSNEEIKKYEIRKVFVL